MLLENLPRLIAEGALQRWVGLDRWRLAVACFLRGGVGPLTSSVPAQGQILLEARVSDGSRRVRWTRLLWDGQEFSSRCDCPESPACLHAAALGIALLEQNSEAPAQPEPGTSAWSAGQEVILYHCLVAPPPKKLTALYSRPYCLWLALDTARLREDLTPGPARPLGLWATPTQPMREQDRAIIERLLPFFQTRGRDFSSPHARGIPVLEADVAPILSDLAGYPYVYGGGLQPLSIRTDRPMKRWVDPTWSLDTVRWELDGTPVAVQAARLVGDDPAWIMFEANLHPVLEADGHEGVPETRDGEAAVQHPAVPPCPRLLLAEEAEDLTIRLSFGYGGGLPIAPTDPRPAVGGELHGVWGFFGRDFGAEEAAIARLHASGLEARGDGVFHAWGEGALAFLAERVPELVAEGWEVFGEERLVRLRVDRRMPTVSLEVSSGIDWFDLETRLSIDGEAVDAASVRAALKNGSRFVRLGSGAHARLPTEWLDRQRFLTESTGFEEGADGALRQRLPRYQALAIRELLEVDPGCRVDPDWLAMVDRMQGRASLAVQPVPAGLRGELRSYQRHGLDYLCFLREQGLHGILADDMGLGKSIQAIAMLLHEHEAGRLGPSLLIAPTSVLYNWLEEFTRFAPGLRVAVHQRTDRPALGEVLAHHDVVITSYALLRRDLAALRAHRYHYLILDEAQMIKNGQSLGARAVCSLQADHRLCLTGTPVENSLLDLWSLFNFLMPGYLGSAKRFRDRYLRDATPETLEALRQRTRPFILRRLKQDVAPELPPRSDMVHYCELGPLQRRLYDDLLTTVRAEVMGNVDRVGLGRSRLSVLVGLLRLRQACCAPALVSATHSSIPSAKIEHFMELVREISAEGHRILVFSQFVKVLSMLAERLRAEHIGYEYLDGQTKDRLERVHRFNSGSDPVFLISLKAGGSGLNLTGADYVLLFDPWWNPAVEEQAADRAHRIGQTRHVFTYKLIARDTVEEKVLALQERKRQVARDVLEDPGFSQAFTREDLEFLFS